MCFVNPLTISLVKAVFHSILCIFLRSRQEQDQSRVLTTNQFSLLESQYKKALEELTISKEELFASSNAQITG